MCTLDRPLPSLPWGQKVCASGQSPTRPQDTFFRGSLLDALVLGDRHTDAAHAPLPRPLTSRVERVKTILNHQMLTSGHSPVLIISEAHLMGFELRNEKLDDFQEDEEIDLRKKQIWVNK